MKHMSVKKNSQSGSALTLMLICMTLMMFLGVGLMLTARQNLIQSSASVKIDKQYYAAESAAQLAVQMFKEAIVSEGYGYKTALIDAPEALTNFNPNEYNAQFREDFENGLSGKLRALYTDEILNKLNGTEFNGEKITLNDLITEDDELVVRSNIYKLTDKDDNVTYFAVVHIDKFKFTVAGTSGGRAVEAEALFNGDMNVNLIEEIFQKTNIAGEDVDNMDELFNSMNGKFLQNGSSGYDEFRSGLEKIIAKAKIIAESGDAVIDTTGQQLVAPGTYTAQALASNATSVKCNGNLTINGNATTGKNSNIRYLHVNGNLTIAGDVNLSNLKNVYVSGNLTINSDAALTGDSTKVNGYIIGSYVTVGGAMRLNLPCSAYHCRFYVPGSIKMITSSNNQKLTGNSIYVAYGKDGEIYLGKAEGTSQDHNGTNIGDNTNAPQFYSANKIDIYLKGSSKAYGLFAALEMIDRDATSTNNIFGFWLGGSGNHGGDIRYDGLSTSAQDNLLDFGGIFTETLITEVVRLPDPDSNEGEVAEYSRIKEDLNIREAAKKAS